MCLGFSNNKPYFLQTKTIFLVKKLSVNLGLLHMSTTENVRQTFSCRIPSSFLRASDSAAKSRTRHKLTKTESDWLTENHCNPKVTLCKTWFDEKLRLQEQICLRTCEWDDLATLFIQVTTQHKSWLRETRLPVGLDLSGMLGTDSYLLWLRLLFYISF